MTRDIETLRAYLRVIVVVVALCATSVPVVYSFSPWRSKPLGMLIMWLTVTLAVAVDVNILFMVWIPRDILVLFWINAIVLSMIGASTASLTFYIWKVNHIRKRVFYLLFSDKLYQVLKRLVQVYIPAISAFYFGLSEIWNLGYGVQVTGTLALVASVLGLMLGISSKTYEKNGPVIDGEFSLTPNENGALDFGLKSVDIDALENKDVVVFRIHRPSIQKIEDIK